MDIIETEKEFQDFLTCARGHDWAVVPIYCNGDKPSHVDDLSLIYIYVIGIDREFTLIFNHTEGLGLSETYIQQFPDTHKIYVYNKKQFLKYLHGDHIIDMNLLEWFYYNTITDDEFDTNAHEFFIRSFSKFSNLNCIIPIVKHIEKCQTIVGKFLNIYDNAELSKSFHLYNNTVIDTLYAIEKNGLYVNVNKFQEKYPLSKTYDNLVYTEYNIYTTTGRPSNRFKGINFAALNKGDGSRAVFQSRFANQGFLISFDYDAYHVRLLADLIDYTFPKQSIHEYLGQYYFQKTELTEEEYSKSKSITFRQLYGGVSPEYMSIPFYAKIHEYTNLLWQKFQADGFIETPLFGRKLYKSFFIDMNPSKLLNYILQAYETERNMAVITLISRRISMFSSKLILYTYDSLLIDFHINDGKECIEMIKDILEQDKKFPVKIEIGSDYDNMIKR